MATTMVSRPEPDSGAPWPCPAPTQVPSHSGWPETRPVYPPATAQEVETHSALKIQLRACNAFREVFVKSEDDDDEEEEEEEDDEEEEDYWADRGERKFRFFLRIFTEASELRRYYEANREGGEYCCFVCGGLGKGKRFKSCLGLAQHSAAMSKAETNRSHWAFGQVVCRVLGWDFDRLPTIVLKGEPLGRFLGNAGAERWGESDAQAAKDNGGETEKRGESVGGVVRDNVVASDDNGGESVEKDGIHGLRADDEERENIGGDVGDNVVAVVNNPGELVKKKGVDNLEDDDGKCTKGEDKHSNEDEEEDPSEDGDEDEEEDPSENDEENPSEEEDPSENEDEEDPSENEDEEYPLEDGVEHENKDENVDVYEDSTVLKSGGLGQPSAKLGDSQGYNQPPVSSSGWPCVEAVEKSPSAILEWPTVTPHLVSVVSSLSAEEEAKLAADQLQYKAVSACQEFFRANCGLAGDEYDSGDEEGEEDGSEDSDSEDEDADASKDSKVFNFFSKLLTERVELREFYVNNHGSGELCCLVCGGIGKKVWKRFMGCVALVQHSNTISRTKKKLAHRAYGQVICQVLGWDMNRFPSIVLRGESPAQAQTLRDSCHSQGDPKENPDCHRDDMKFGTDNDDVEIVLEKDSCVQTK